MRLEVGTGAGAADPWEQGQGRAGLAAVCGMASRGRLRPGGMVPRASLGIPQARLML